MFKIVILESSLVSKNSGNFNSKQNANIIEIFYMSMNQDREVRLPLLFL